jgi:type IV pilus assembly protein PilX
MRPRTSPRRTERGIVLITSILLLVVITLMALGMFKSFGLQERIAGNMREKHRALQAAVTAEEYAEWYLIQPGNAINITTTCSTAPTSAATSSTASGQVCKNAINGSTTASPVYTPPTAAQWAALGSTYCPPFGAGSVAFLTAPTGCTSATSSSYTSFYQAPQFYIQYLGVSADGTGTIFQIDAIAYGGTSNTVAEVRSTYLVASGSQDLGAL